MLRVMTAVAPMGTGPRNCSCQMRPSCSPSMWQVLQAIQRPWESSGRALLWNRRFPLSSSGGRGERRPDLSIDHPIRFGKMEIGRAHV